MKANEFQEMMMQMMKKNNEMLEKMDARITALEQKKVATSPSGKNDVVIVEAKTVSKEIKVPEKNRKHRDYTLKDGTECFDYGVFTIVKESARKYRVDPSRVYVKKYGKSFIPSDHRNAYKEFAEIYKVNKKEMPSFKDNNGNDVKWFRVYFTSMITAEEAICTFHPATK